MFLKYVLAGQFYLPVIIDGTLVFSIAALHLLMHPLLDFSF